MNVLKKIVQTGVLASLLYSGTVAKAENEHDFWVHGSPEARHEEYAKRGYFKAPESEKYGFSLYLNQTNPVTLSRLEEQLAKLPRPLRNALKEVRINNQNETAKGGDIGGRAGPGGALAIYSNEGLTNGSFFHESGHILIESLSPEKQQEFLKRWEKIAQFKYGKHNTTENETEWKSGANVERLRSLKTYIEKIEPVLTKEKTELTILRHEIEKDSGVDAGYLARVADFNTRGETFNNQATEYGSAVREYNTLLPHFHEPREGVFSAYGATNKGEDIAEAMKAILHNPQRARDLFKNPDKRYAEKMRLVAEYGNFKLEEYFNK